MPAPHLFKPFNNRPVASGKLLVKTLDGEDG
jgi:hypothetical protein